MAINPYLNKTSNVEIVYGGCDHIVVLQPGDNLRKIAKKNNTTIKALAEENNLRPNSKGQYAIGKKTSLCIPQSAGALQRQAALFSTLDSAKATSWMPQTQEESVGFDNLGRRWSQMHGEMINVTVLHGGDEVVVRAKVLRAWATEGLSVIPFVKVEIAENTPGYVKALNPFKDGETRYIPGGTYTTYLSKPFGFQFLKPEIIRIDD